MKIKFIVIFSLLIFLSCKNNKTEMKQEVDTRGYIVKVGDVAPDFEIEYPDGRRVMLSSLRGKLVMLQFTASWCGVCRKEMPYLESEIWQKNKGNSNFVLLGVDYKESKEVAVKFAKDMNITYPMTLDKDGEKFDLFCGHDAGVTRNVLIDKDGEIVLLTRLFEMQEFGNMVLFIDKELDNYNLHK